MTTYVSKLYKNAIKAENEIIKNYMAGSDKPFNWYYGTYKEGKEDYKCVTEGHVLIAFGFDSFVLDKAIFETHNKILNEDTISQMVNKVDATFESAHIVGTKIVQGAKKYTCCVLKKESTGEEILFNENYKKYFTNDVDYKVFNTVTPIKVYSGDVFLGVILPVRDMTK